jgi:ATP-dependent Clp protease ATP-binding subunit ClpA
MTESVWRRASSRISLPCSSAVTLAEAEARRLDDNHVGTEHIMLGLLAVDGCQAASALAELSVRRESFESVLQAEEGQSPEGPIPFAPRGLRILDVAIVEADGLADQKIGTAHILLGVVSESLEWSKPGPHHLRTVAEKLGFTLDDVRRTATASPERVEF